MPDLYWRCPILGVKPTATVLAYAMPAAAPSYMQSPAAGAEATGASSPAVGKGEEVQKLRQEFEKNHALVVAQHVGMGQVLFIGFDSTWRMRYRVGDTYHHKFWGQVMRWATASKLPAGTNLVKLGTDRTATARTRISPPAQNPASGLLGAGGQRRRREGLLRQTLVLRKTLTYVPDSPGMYKAHLGELPSGTYRLEPLLAVGSGDPRSGKGQGGHDGVFCRPLHAGRTGGVLRRPRHAGPDRLLQRRRAGGTLRGPARAVGAGAGRKLATHEVEQYTLWDSWPMLALIMVLVSAEWLLRKKVGLA